MLFPPFQYPCSSGPKLPVHLDSACEVQGTAAEEAAVKVRGRRWGKPDVLRPCHPSPELKCDTSIKAGSISPSLSLQFHLKCHSAVVLTSPHFLPLSVSVSGGLYTQPKPFIKKLQHDQLTSLCHFHTYITFWAPDGPGIPAAGH